MQTSALVNESESSIAIVSPGRNAGRFYAAWLRSIEAQQYRHCEVLLVDDGSDDEQQPDSLAALAGSAPSWVRYLRQEPSGPAAARNHAIRASKSDYVAFLDLDDRWAPGHLAALAAALDADPDAGIAQGLIRKFLITPGGEAYFCSEPYRFVNLGAALYRRSVLDELGLFDTSLQFGEDFDLIVRCWEAGVRKLEIPSVSLLYHRHEENMTNGKNIVDLGAVRVYKRRIDRMRRGLVDPALVAARRVNFADYLGRTVGPFDEGLREPVEW